MKTIQTKKKVVPKKKSSVPVDKGTKKISTAEVTKKIDQALKAASKMENEDTSPLAILIRARAIVDKSWVKGNYYAAAPKHIKIRINKTGDYNSENMIHLNSPEFATHFCAVGAHERAQWEKLGNFNRSKTKSALTKALDEMHVKGTAHVRSGSVPDLNDCPLTTKADVLELFDRAIRIEKEKIHADAEKKAADKAQGKLKIGK